MADTLKRFMDKITDYWFSPAGLAVGFSALLFISFWIYQLRTNDESYGVRIDRLELSQEANSISREEWQLRSLIELQKMAVITAKTTAVVDGLLTNMQALTNRVQRNEGDIRENTRDGE